METNNKFLEETRNFFGEKKELLIATILVVLLLAVVAIIMYRNSKVVKEEVQSYFSTEQKVIIGTLVTLVLIELILAYFGFFSIQFGSGTAAHHGSNAPASFLAGSSDQGGGKAPEGGTQTKIASGSDHKYLDILGFNFGQAIVGGTSVYFARQHSKPEKR